MKRILAVAAVCIFAVTALMLVRCTELTGSEPTDVKLEAATDATVKVSWTAPAEGTPDKYIVSFMETGTTTYVPFDTVTTTSATHDPAGKTGAYKVVAMFGSTEYAAASAPSSAPIANAATSLSELNASGNSGYGWAKTAGTATTYSMTQAANAASIDIYLTDFATGFAGPEYSIASPDIARGSDPGATGVVPDAAWRVNAIAKVTGSENDPLPVHSTTTYAQYQEIDQTPFLMAVYTADGYYALIHLDSKNLGSGTVQTKSWYQAVKGLRLIQH
jgi:hypothetical protein